MCHLIVYNVLLLLKRTPYKAIATIKMALYSKENSPKTIKAPILTILLVTHSLLFSLLCTSLFHIPCLSVYIFYICIHYKKIVVFSHTKNVTLFFIHIGLEATLDERQGPVSNEIEQSYWLRAINWTHGL
jgi:hypothetical protein